MKVSLPIFLVIALGHQNVRAMDWDQDNRSPEEDIKRDRAMRRAYYESQGAQSPDPESLSVANLSVVDPDLTRSASKASSRSRKAVVQESEEESTDSEAEQKARKKAAKKKAAKKAKNKKSKSRSKKKSKRDSSDEDDSSASEDSDSEDSSDSDSDSDVPVKKAKKSKLDRQVEKMDKEQQKKDNRAKKAEEKAAKKITNQKAVKEAYAAMVASKPGFPPQAQWEYFQPELPISCQSLKDLAVGKWTRNDVTLVQQVRHVSFPIVVIDTSTAMMEPHSSSKNHFQIALASVAKLAGLRTAVLTHHNGGQVTAPQYDMSQRHRFYTTHNYPVNDGIDPKWKEATKTNQPRIDQEICNVEQFTLVPTIAEEKDVKMFYQGTRLAGKTNHAALIRRIYSEYERLMADQGTENQIAVHYVTSGYPEVDGAKFSLNLLRTTLLDSVAHFKGLGGSTNFRISVELTSNKYLSYWKALDADDNVPLDVMLSDHQDEENQIRLVQKKLIGSAVKYPESTHNLRKVFIPADSINDDKLKGQDRKTWQAGNVLCTADDLKDVSVKMSVLKQGGQLQLPQDRQGSGRVNTGMFGLGRSNSRREQ